MLTSQQPGNEQRKLAFFFFFRIKKDLLLCFE
jgi:hypothetical protein